MGSRGTMGRGEVEAAEWMWRSRWVQPTSSVSFQCCFSQSFFTCLQRGIFPKSPGDTGYKRSQSLSHPDSLSQLVVWPSGMWTVLLHTYWDVPVLHAGVATAAPGEELLGHADCSGLSDYGLLLLYKTSNRKDGLIVIFKILVLIC